MIRKLQLPLRIDVKALELYNIFATNIIPGDFPDRYEFIYEGFRQSLRSKQCNEPYEKMISACLCVVNVETKHGWDGVDKLRDPTEVYEYKSSSKNPASPSGTINDDSVAKIEKCERLIREGKIGWMILAGANKQTCTLDCIYKFPLHIYSEHRRECLAALIGKNQRKERHTRSTYRLDVKSSVKLCEKFEQEYYVWKRD